MAKTIEEILQYIKSELDSDDSEIYLDVDDYKVIVEALEQEPILDKIRTEIVKNKTEHEMRITEKDIEIKWLISDIYCDIFNILNKYNAKSGDNK